jgi:hypothetical protein
MWSFLHRQGLYFLIGFVATFLVYLFIKIGSKDVLWGMAFGAIGGVVLSTIIFFLERKFPERGTASTGE